ncbi:MAG TPA: DNA topoisomerase 3, partial [Thermoanaerobaculia bacterium]
MSVAVVAEKPSVGRDLARVLGAEKRGEGYLHGNGYVVTWAIGHLVALAEPGEMRPEWKKWRRDQLPILPREWPLVVSEATAAQFAVVRKILVSPHVSAVICATDAGREGELIFRYVYEAAGCTKPFERLWISSLTPEAIRRGFASLRAGRDLDPLADAARGRSRADWLVGMNLSRACSLAFDEDLSVGRVQTPTLAMVVERELAIRAFVPEDYLEIEATFAPPEGTPGVTYRGTWFRGAEPGGAQGQSHPKRLPADGEEAKRIVERALSAAGRCAVESVEAETRRLSPPLLYDLTELQRHANRLFGWSAQKTLGLAQALYERWKVLSYPRTDSRHLSRDVAATLPEIVAAIRGPYEGRLAPGTGERELGRRFVDDAKVTDHHAILPTTTRAEGLGLSADEQALYDLVCRRLLSAWHGDHVWAVTTVITGIETASESGPLVDRFASTGTAIEEVGWKVLDLNPKGGEIRAPSAPRAPGSSADDAADDASQELPPGLAAGQPKRVTEAEAIAKKTRPPRRFTEGTLLTAMETAGRTLDDKELSAAMRETGLGTPATRAETIETLLRRAYIERQGKALAATEKGIRLIAVVHPQVKSPEMTGRWEAELKRIERRQTNLPAFLRAIEDYVRDVVGSTFSTTPAVFGLGGRTTAGASAAGGAAWRDPASAQSGASPSNAARPSTASTDVGNHAVTGPAAGASRASSASEPFHRAPVPVERLADLLRDPFRLPSFRPFQEAVCRAVVEGRDALLVMPTGAGKSLCYQLPGLARGGTTLVVSPLIALMEDQVGKLRELGLRAERIHSGRDRAESRQVARDYLDGRLDFLFIAPERLAVPGFPELLARRKPVLVAIDEAHCISQWGHDFRPEYRMLGERLPPLRPAPVIGLTATATPRVQDDIVAQLGLAGAGRFIHGFRRTNIAVEVSETRPGARRAAVRALLADPARRPAIIYAPTRKEADALGAELALDMPAAAYHAGMTGAARDRVQADFLAGRLEVIVATIAFGMGVDKPNVRTVVHTGLPGSLEGYYQEIGRAGRDGL